jgi:hypothetical protein
MSNGLILANNEPASATSAAATSSTVVVGTVADLFTDPTKEPNGLA